MTTSFHKPPGDGNLLANLGRHAQAADSREDWPEAAWQLGAGLEWWRTACRPCGGAGRRLWPR